MHLHPAGARLLHVDRGVFAGGLRGLADWVDLSHLDYLRFLLALNLRWTVCAAREALILKILVGLSAIILLILPVEYLLLVLFERSVARRLNVRGGQ